jgi:hypothetical protein
MFRKNIVLTKFGLLGKQHKGHSVIPSASIYYGRYAYKVVINSDQDNIHSFRDYFFMFGFNSLKERFRLYTNKTNNQLYVFLQTQKDLDTVLTAFDGYIVSLHGPLTEGHRKKLLNPTHFIEVRNSKFFKKYDTRVFMRRPWSRSLGNYWSASKWGGNGNRWNELHDFLNDHLPGDYKRFGYTGSFYMMFYVNRKDYDTLYPFLKMMFNDTEIYTTEALIVEK